jgi:hypothetical protein
MRGDTRGTVHTHIITTRAATFTYVEHKKAQQTITRHTQYIMNTHRHHHKYLKKSQRKKLRFLCIFKRLLSHYLIMAIAKLDLYVPFNYFYLSYIF